MGGCPSFGELFHLKFYNPAVPPTESGSRGGQAPPTTPDCQRRRGPGGLELWLLLFFFFPPSLSPGCFSDTSFFRIGKKKKKKASASRRLQWSVLGLQRQSSPTFPLPPQLRARLKLRLCWGPNLPAAHLHSNVRAKAPGSGLQPGGPTLPRLRPARSCASPSPGPVWKGASGRPGRTPREGGALPRPGAGGQGAPAPGTLRASLPNVAGGHSRGTDRKRARGDARTRDHSTETARG